MKKGKILYILLFLNQFALGRVFVKQDKKDAKTTFDFSVSCSAYNRVHQVAWLGAGENVEGDDAQYSISVARYMSMEGSGSFGEVVPIISPRAMEKTNLFTNSRKKPYELDVPNPLRGKACKLMMLYETVPVVVLKDEPNSLYLLSEIFVDSEGNRDGGSSISCFSFNEKEIIYHIAQYRQYLFVFHAQGEFGKDETSRVTVLQADHGQTLKKDNQTPYVYHTFQTVASHKIQKDNAVLMGDAGLPLAALGTEVKAVEYGGKLYVAFSIKTDKQGTGCSLIEMSLEQKEHRYKGFGWLSYEETVEVAREHAQLIDHEEVDNSVLQVIKEQFERQSKDDDFDNQKENLYSEMLESLSDQEIIDTVKDCWKARKKEEEERKKAEAEKAAAQQEGKEDASKEDGTQQEQVSKPEESDAKEEASKEDEQGKVEVKTDAVQSVQKEEKETKEEKIEEVVEEGYTVKDGELLYKIVFTSPLPEEARDRDRLPFYLANGESIAAGGLAPMFTSTGLSYLVYASGSTISTLAFDNDGLSLLKGDTQDGFSHDHFLNRKYKRGGNSRLLTTYELPHAVADIQVRGDAIYVRDAHRPGVFSYRVIFNEQGLVEGWAATEHCVSDKHVDNFYVSTQGPFAWYGCKEPNGYAFHQMMWEQSTDIIDEFVEAVNQVLPKENYGVQGLFSLQCNELYTPQGFLVATGYEHVVVGFVDKVDGRTALEVQVESLFGAGAIVSAEVVQNIDEQSEWLVVGGVGGLYANVTASILGFGVVNSLGDVFSQNGSWKKIGDFSFVKKIIKDAYFVNRMYVVANDGVYKVDVGKDMFAKPQIIKLFDASQIGGRFDHVTDLFVDRDFAIIGTSKGLYVLNSLSGLEKAEKLSLDGTVGAVCKIISVAGSEKLDNLYVVSNDPYRQSSKLHRLVIKNKQCTLFLDGKYRDLQNRSSTTRGSFLDMNTTCSSFFSNGAWNVKMNFPYKNEFKAIQCYQGVRSGTDTLRDAHRGSLKNVYLSYVEGAQNIGGMIHDKNLGCWMIFGDNGIRILS